MHRSLLITLLLVVVGVSGRPAQGDEPAAKGAPLTPELREKCVHILRETLETEAQFVKVHAAEFLLDLSYPQQVASTFEAERQAHEQQPRYRVGIWRVLAQAAPTPQEREAWVAKIRAVLSDPNAPDPIHALESLAKLNHRLTQDDTLRKRVSEAARADLPSAPYARWLLAVSGGAHEQTQLAELLNSDVPTARLVTAYALTRLRTTDPAILQKLSDAAKREPESSPARPYLLSAAWLLTKDDKAARTFREALLAAAPGGGIAEKTLACAALAERSTPADFPALLDWLDDPQADVRASAAAALLRIARRGSHRLANLDWGVIALYFLSMLGIGWFYSYRAKTADDYLLGGRNMKPWTVGLSLFATLCSTISYLSWPGEMIQHGPMYFASLLSYPFVAVMVGWWLIPFFMRLPVTSAYEILETRLGVRVRLLGAILFLLIRLLWMSVILDVTTGVVLLPLLGLDVSYSPYVCAVLGLTTVVYSSMGGIKAVVMTDVVQTFILLAGAVATLGVVTWKLGGVSLWWPTTWAPNWDPLVFGFDPRARMSVLGAFMSTFFWYLCTAGSDQMAIQRYLSTRDVKSARRMFNISMAAGASVAMLLAFVGLALLAWFQSHPEMLGEGQSVAKNADQLFPRFIVAGLPDGVSGLVVSGLLAAAMSSLSSGLSSSCAVITVDFIDRFSKTTLSPQSEMRRARYVSWCVGIVVVLLSTVVGLVQGNVLEVAAKVVNLLVAPLFGLFFMALFVRRATSFGTFVGAACGLATVVLVNYWSVLSTYWPLLGTVKGPSFLWATPLGLFVQVGTGTLASLLPIGTSQPLIGSTTSQTPGEPS